MAAPLDHRRRPNRARGLVRALIWSGVIALGALGVERAARSQVTDPISAPLVDADSSSILRSILEAMGLDRPDVPPRERPEPPVKVAAEDRAAAIQALDLLDRLRVEPERRAGYDRAAWAHWRDMDDNCLDARDEVLVAESRVRAQLDRSGCNVVRGLWLDPFTGERETDPTAIEVDHMVPLAEAYRSGGYAWDAARRAAYANDLGDPRSLTATTTAANQGKSDQGPEDWLPPNPSYRCRYVADWVVVKARWALAMDERERAVAGNLLTECATDEGERQEP